VTYGVRVLHAIGVRSMVFTNAAGGINLALERGGLVLISDHINLQGSNPLVGPNDDSLGPRFPDMSEAYSRATARRQAGGRGTVHPMPEGVYAAMLGPSYETPAEIRYLRAIGADVVGMSTVPEVIVANHMGMKVLGISCVTNMAAGILPQKINHEEVLETGAMVRDTLVRFLKALLPPDRRCPVASSLDRLAAVNASMAGSPGGADASTPALATVLAEISVARRGPDLAPTGHSDLSRCLQQTTSQTRTTARRALRAVHCVLVAEKWVWMIRQPSFLRW
jgi:inosine/guanosine/xanthosine phosphorylase family protein